MTDTKTYHRTVITVEVLTADDPLDVVCLEDLGHLIDTGDASGQVEVTEREEVGPLRMARLLVAQGSDPNFLLGDEHVVIDNEERVDVLTCDEVIEQLRAGAIVPCPPPIGGDVYPAYYTPVEDPQPPVDGDWRNVQVGWWYEDRGMHVGCWYLSVAPDVDDPLTALRDTIVDWATNEGAATVIANGHSLCWGDLNEVDPKVYLRHGLRIIAPAQTYDRVTVNHDETVYDPSDI